MVKKKYIAPNLITAGNMFLGYLSITESIKGNYKMAILFILLAMVCDGLDGKTARKLDAFSEFGKEFDSFCDAISFGLAPSMLIYSILMSQVPGSPFVVPVSFLYALCGVMRLVKFNIINVASSEKGDFSGMPIPSAASMVCSYFLFCYMVNKHLGINLFNIDALMAITVIAAVLMVSTMKFKTPDKAFPFIPKKFAGAFILLVVITLPISLFIVTYAYVLINIMAHVTKRFFGSENSSDDNDEIEEIIEVIEEENSEEKDLEEYHK